MINTYNDLMNYLRELNTVSIIVRLTLATICAGILGHERGKRKDLQVLEHILWCALGQQWLW